MHSLNEHSDCLAGIWTLTAQRKQQIENEKKKDMKNSHVVNETRTFRFHSLAGRTEVSLVEAVQRNRILNK